MADQNLGREIDKAIGGPKLIEDDLVVFDDAKKRFIKDIDSSKDVEKRLDEIGKLLEVSTDNLEKIKGQKALKRAWETVTGGNSRLRKINEENLLKVQKGALYFMQQLMRSNDLTLEVVQAVLKRVNAQSIQNAKLKMYLLQYSKQVSDRLRRHDSRLADHEERITSLENNRNIFIRIIRFLFIRLPKSVLVRLGLRKTKGISKFDYKQYLRDLPAVKQIVSSSLAGQVTEENILQPLIPILQVNEKIQDICAKIPDNITLEKWPSIAKKILKASGNNGSLPEEVAKSSAALANQLIQGHYKVAGAILDCLGLSQETDLQLSLEIDQEEFEAMSDKIFEDASDNWRLDEINETESYLSDNFSKFETICQENGWVSFGKELLEDFTLGILPISSNDSEFSYFYQTKVVELISHWAGWAQQVSSTNSKIIQTTSNDILNALSNKYEFLWTELAEREIYLSPLIEAAHKES